MTDKPTLIEIIDLIEDVTEKYLELGINSAGKSHISVPENILAMQWNLVVKIKAYGGE